MRLDETDRRLFREYSRDGLYFYAENLATSTQLASRLGIHRETVVAHLAKLEEGRFIMPWLLDAAPPTVPLASTRLVIQGSSPWQDERLMELVGLVEGVKSIDEYGASWGLSIFAEDDRSLASRRALVLRLCGGKIEAEDLAPLPRRGSWDGLAPRQLRLAAHVVGARSPDHAACARQLGVSERTVRRDLDELARRRALALFYGGDVRYEGGLLARFHVGFPSGASPATSPGPGVLEAEHVLKFKAVGGRAMVYVVPAPDARRLGDLAGRTREGTGPIELDWRPWTRRRTHPAYFEWLRDVLLRRAAILEKP